jgi:hypothetical protein
LYRLLRIDAQNQFSKIKKSSTQIRAHQTQIQASKKEAAVSHAERDGEPSVVAAGRGRATEVCRQPRSEPAAAGSRLECRLVGVEVLAAVVEGTAPCLSAATVASIRHYHAELS